MATNTPNYNLIKPDGNDPVNIADINGNSDIIDTTLKSLNDRILPLATQSQAQIGTDNTTLMTPLRTKQAIISNVFLGVNTKGVNDSISSFPNGTSTMMNYSTAGVFPSNFGTLTTFRADDYGYQQYASVNSSVIYTRNWNTSGSWSSWITERPIATQAQAQTGTDNTTTMTPLRTKQAIDNSPITRYGTATGTNALTITANPLFDNLYNGLTVKFKNTTANTGNVTINVNAKGVKSVLNNDGTQIQQGKLKANAMYEITYDGTNFYLTKGGGESSPIKSIQRGLANIALSSDSVDVTISPINLSKSIVKISYSNGNNISGTSSENNVLAKFNGNNKITFSRGASSANVSKVVSWEVVEFEDSVNVYTGDTSISNGNATTSVTLSESIDLNKTQLYFSYKNNASSQYSQDVRGLILSDTNLSFGRGESSFNSDITWYLVEIK